MGKREEQAKELHVNPHYLSDAARVWKHGGPQLVEGIDNGSITLQQALRKMGCYTQRDRNRARARLVESLCHAVLEDDLFEAKRFAVHLLSSRFRGAKREAFLNEHGFTQKPEEEKGPFV